MDLIRIGEPQRPEMAAWRYGDQFGRRRRRLWTYSAMGVAAAAGVMVGGERLRPAAGGTALDFVPREQPFGAGSNPSNIVDACYPYGSVQVPSGTEPIVLHRDAVSGGGYMMLGCVISADMDLIGQLQPHSPARFVEVTMDQALAARADRQAALAALRAHLGR